MSNIQLYIPLQLAPPYPVKHWQVFGPTHSSVELQAGEWQTAEYRNRLKLRL